MKTFRYDVRRLQGKPIAVVSLQGNLDSPASHKLNEALDSVLDETGGGDVVSQLVVDMARVGYVNSEGWRVLLQRARELDQRHGQLRVADLSADLETVFRMLGLTEVIQCHDNLDEALQASVDAGSGSPSD